MTRITHPHRSRGFRRDEITADRHVRGIRCGHAHSGSGRIAAYPGDWYGQCDGCGNFVVVAQCRDALPGEPGSKPGGVIRW